MSTGHQNTNGTTTTSSLGDINNILYPANLIDLRVQPAIQTNTTPIEHMVIPELTRYLGNNSRVIIKKQKRPTIFVNIIHKTLKNIRFDSEMIKKNFSKLRLQEKSIFVDDHDVSSSSCDNVVSRPCDSDSANDIALSNKMDKMNIIKSAEYLNSNVSNAAAPRIFNYPLTTNDVGVPSNSSNTMTIDKGGFNLKLDHSENRYRRLFEDKNTNDISVFSNNVHKMNIDKCALNSNTLHHLKKRVPHLFGDRTDNSIDVFSNCIMKTNMCLFNSRSKTSSVTPTRVTETSDDLDIPSNKMNFEQ